MHGRMMGMRIKPRDIEVPECDPFKCDLLDRRDAVEALTNIVGNLEGPCALAVDAPWGAGKTTFLWIWAQHLRKEGFPVIEFNAWKSDFSENPFVVLSTEIMRGLKSSGGEGSEQEKNNNNFANSAKEVLRSIAPDAIRLAVGLVPVFGQPMGEVLGKLADEMLSRHKDTEKVVEKFTGNLKAAAESLSLVHNNRSLILMIDELDRCRPSYAVELLEMAKHLFSVDRIVFVLAVNRAQLAHSVRALYGSDFDAEGYLRRFFDVDFRLPEPSRDAFIAAQLQVTGIADYFDKEVKRKESGENLRTMLQIFFNASDLSLRTVGQAIHRLGLLYASLRRDQHDYTLATTVALILRTLDQELYGRFVKDEISDADVVDEVFDRSGLKALQNQESRYAFEAVVVLARHRAPPGRLMSIYNTPLLRRYRKQLEEALPDSTQPTHFDDQQLLKAYKELFEAGDLAAHEPQRMHAYGVFTKVRCYLQTTPIGFREAVQRLELLTTTLVDQ